MAATVDQCDTGTIAMAFANNLLHFRFFSFKEKKRSPVGSWQRLNLKTSRPPLASFSMMIYRFIGILPSAIPMAPCPHQPCPRPRPICNVFFIRENQNLLQYIMKLLFIIVYYLLGGCFYMRQFLHVM